MIKGWNITTTTVNKKPTNVIELIEQVRAELVVYRREGSNAGNPLNAQSVGRLRTRRRSATPLTLPLPRADGGSCWRSVNQLVRAITVEALWHYLDQPTYDEPSRPESRQPAIHSAIVHHHNLKPWRPPATPPTIFQPTTCPRRPHFPPSLAPTLSLQ